MRTTVTLDSDTESAVRRLMDERGVSFKQALNDAIRAGTGKPAVDVAWTMTHDFGRWTVDLDRALQLAAELEDEERVRAIMSGR